MVGLQCTRDNFTGRGTVKVINSDGKVILEETYGPQSVTPSIDGKLTSFIAPKSMTKLTLKADFYDEKDNLMDEIELVYDTSKFLNIKKTLDLRIYKNNQVSSSFTTDEALRYTIEYKDEHGNPVDGQIAVFLSSPDNKIVRMDHRDIHNTLNEDMILKGLESGTYTLKAVETQEHLVSEKTITITKTSSPTQKEPETAPKNPLITGLVILVLAALVIYAVKSRTK